MRNAPRYGCGCEPTAATVDVLRYVFGNRVESGATVTRTGGSRWSYAPNQR